MRWSWIWAVAALGCGKGSDSGGEIADIQATLTTLCYDECQRLEDCDTNEYKTLERCTTQWCDAAALNWTENLFPLSCANAKAFVRAVEACHATDCPANGAAAGCWDDSQSACDQ